MTAPKIGDVVRIGDLPDGSECETSDGPNSARWLVRGQTINGRVVEVDDLRAITQPASALVRVVSLPAEQMPPALAESAQHWHAKHRDAEAALARLTAEWDERARELHVQHHADVDAVLALQADLARVTAERDSLRDEVSDAFELPRGVGPAPGEMVRLASEMRSAIARLTANRDAQANVTRTWSARAIAAEEKVTPLQEAAAENGRLRAEVVRVTTERQSFAAETALAACAPRDAAIERLEAECTRLRTVATGYATTRRDRDAVATICEALGIAQTPYAPTPDGALLAIRDLRAELIAHTERTQEAREMLASERGALGKICEALGMGEADDRTPFGACEAIARLRAEVQKSRKAEAALATICADLCTPETPYTATPAGALQAIADMQAETIASAQRANAARESWASIREQLDAWTTRICSALDMQPEDGATLDDAVRVIGELCEWQREVTAAQNAADELRATLATRDAQEGDRIAAWEKRTGRVACHRCWYPAHPIMFDGVLLCDACKGDDERASAEEGDVKRDAHWYCKFCGDTEPAEEPYKVGDKEPCTTCGEGTAHVMTLADGARFASEVARGVRKPERSYTP